MNEPLYQPSPEAVRHLGVPNTDPHVRYDWRMVTGCLVSGIFRDMGPLAHTIP